MKKLVWWKAVIAAAVFFNVSIFIFNQLALRSIRSCLSTGGICFENYSFQVYVFLFVLGAFLSYYFAKANKPLAVLFYLTVSILLLFVILAIITFILVGNHCAGVPEGYGCL
jgi:predicted membrane-bound spermidine synthase